MASTPALTIAIQALHQAIAEHPDPQQKQTLAVCLQNMLKVQAQDHAQATQGGGAQPAQMPQPNGGPNPMAALAQVLGSR